MRLFATRNLTDLNFNFPPMKPLIKPHSLPIFEYGLNLAALFLLTSSVLS